MISTTRRQVLWQRGTTETNLSLIGINLIFINVEKVQPMLTRDHCSCGQSLSSRLTQSSLGLRNHILSHRGPICKLSEPDNLAF